MELLKDASAVVSSDENPKIKEELLGSNEYNCPEKVATSRKSASEEEREFKVTCPGNGSKHVVRGRVTDNLLSVLKSNQYVRTWMEENKKKEFHLIEKKMTWNSFINLGMPLKYLPDDSEFEMKSYKLTSEVWYRQYDNRKECVLFYVRGTGSRNYGKQSRRVIKNDKLINENCTFCIFAPKRESIKDAVCNDGRFLPFLKEENWTLEQKGTIRENNHLVDTLSDQPDEVYEINVQPKKGARYSSDLNKKPNDVDLAGGQLSPPEMPQGQPDCEQGQLSASKTQQPQPDCEQGQLGASKLQYLECQILHLYPKLKEEGKNISKFLSHKNKDFEVYKKNFGKKVNDSLSAKLVETLSTRMNSVGYIEWKDNLGCLKGAATCFVLHGRYILTCHHVVKAIVGEGTEAKDWGNRIKQLACVNFSYKEKHPKKNWFSLENWFQISDEDLDFAVLKLEENESENHPPPGLLQFHSPPPPNGPIFITGHPKGGIKAMDICLVVSIFERGDKYSKHLQKRQSIECSKYVCGYKSQGKDCIHAYNPKGFDKKKSSPDLVTYNTCFFEGSSGSPVFDKSGQLVAMHAAGFAYEMSNKECSIIEWGYLICSIILKMQSKFKPWFDSTFLPDTSEDSSHVDAFQNELDEEMDTN